MMHPSGTPTSEDAALEQLWRQVCASRGTPAPDAAGLIRLMEDLETHARDKLRSVLLLAVRGREPPGELSVLSWAAACTRPALLGQLQSCGLAFTSAGLFACGLALRQEGWDMQHRIAQLAGNPADVDTLRTWLPAVLPVEPGESELGQHNEAGPSGHEEVAVDAPLFPWPDDADDHGLPGDQATGWEGEPMNDIPTASASTPSVALPVLPTRFARQQPEAFPNACGPASAAGGAPHEPRLRLRLFGKAAAHTLEVTAHRRGGDFLGVHVVSIDSAHALGAGGGYAWERKLVLQLTPEEMPAVIATLMGLTPSVRFGHHGANRDKFVEVRSQEGGLVIVTGERALSY
ncbi:hypothetical protein BH10PSE16_BH10PSE16_20510 [soil metagenome]